MDRRSMAAVSLALSLILALALPIGAIAKGKPTMEATNNLSVPTIMVGGGGFTGVACGVETPSVLAAPSGVPETGYEVEPDAYYYVQGVHKWQAQCYSTTGTPGVVAAWGDNLTGDAKLKAGSPIRVELGLFNSTGPAVDGYTVVKLEPSKLDRESRYGTLAAGDLASGFQGNPTSFTTVRVFDAGVTFSIKNVDTGAYVVPLGTNASAEINATGAVVYGYNLRVTTAGRYEITFITPSVTIGDTDAGTYTDNSVTLIITVTSGGGGGKGNH
jgi:hypothetical protein